MARNEGQELEQNQRQRGERAESGNRAELGARLNQPEREASGEPTECGRGRAHFGNRDENGIAEQQTRRGSGANREDGRARRPKTRMHAAQALGHRTGSAQREQQPAGGNEISVEALEQPEESHRQNQTDGPFGSDGLLEGNCRGETPAEKALPRRDVRNRSNRERVKQRPDEQRQGDRLQEAAAAEAGMRFLGAFRDGLKARQKIGHDLKSQEDRDERSGAEGGMEIRRRAARGADSQHEDEQQQYRRGSRV